jgi:hypothetical protein
VSRSEAGLKLADRSPEVDLEIEEFTPWLTMEFIEGGSGGCVATSNTAHSDICAFSRGSQPVSAHNVPSRKLD